MDAEGLISLLKELNLPPGHYALFGGACLTIRHLRNLNDLDFFISKDLYKQLQKSGWTETSQHKRAPYLIHKMHHIDIQAFSVWEGKGWQPKIQSYISNPEEIENFPFMPLDELYEWKRATRRIKDLKDLKLIDAYWNRAINT